MKAPDKIYLPNKIDLVRAAILKAQNATDDIEYIRKDALLDYLKKQKRECEGVIKNNPNDDSVWAEMHWYEELIEKLNSL